MIWRLSKILSDVAWRINKLCGSVLVHPDELYALHEQEHLRRLLQYLKVDCVFDVGANAGQYAKMLRKLGYTEHIVSFEPIPWLADQIRQVATNDKKWHVEAIALADETGNGYFNVMAGSQFSSLGTPRHDDTRRFLQKNVMNRRIQVRKETLDHVFERLKRLYGFKRPFLKMDTQGFDVSILRAGRAIAPAFVGLQSELAIKRIYEEAVDFREAISLYNDLGFELSAFVPNNSGHFPVLVEIDCIMVRSDLMPKEDQRG